MTGVSERRLRARVRVSYVKVAEYQARGALHFHAVIRLDAAQPKATRELVEPPPAGFSVALLADAIRAAVRHVRAPVPKATKRPRRGQQRLEVEQRRERLAEVRWGSQLDVRVLEAGELASCAGYIAKYATKSTEACGGL